MSHEHEDVRDAGEDTGVCVGLACGDQLPTHDKLRLSASNVYRQLCGTLPSP